MIVCQMTDALFCFFPSDMFPAAKMRRVPGKFPGPFKKRKLYAGKSSPGDDKRAKTPKRHGPGGQRRDRTGEGQERKWGTKPGDRVKPFGKKFGPGAKKYGGGRPGDGDRKFGGRKKFEGNKTFGGKKTTERRFKSKDQKGKPGFKKRGPGGGAKQGFKQKKGKG